jgi:hypothetical protein
MSLTSLILLYLTYLSISLHGAVHHVVKRARFDHNAFEIIQKRQLVAYLPARIPAETTTELAVLTFITPSPSATPIAVTQQSQLVTSYVPQITVCALPPLAFVSGTFSNPASSGPPYLNYSVSTPPGLGECLTTYSPTVTPVCYTVLNGIASRVTVSDCTQSITFSSDVYFSLDSSEPTPTALCLATQAPQIRPVTTYYVAPWDELTSGETPEHVQVNVCATHANDTTVCVDFIENWSTTTVMSVASSTTHVDITTTVKGPAIVMVETYHMDVTATKTIFALSTHMGLEYEFETLKTIRGAPYSEKSTTTVTTTSTSTITRSVVYNRPEASTLSRQVRSVTGVVELLLIFRKCH